MKFRYCQKFVENQQIYKSRFKSCSVFCYFIVRGLYGPPLKTIIGNTLLDFWNLSRNARGLKNQPPQLKEGLIWLYLRGIGLNWSLKFDIHIMWINHETSKLRYFQSRNLFIYILGLSLLKCSVDSQYNCQARVQVISMWILTDLIWTEGLKSLKDLDL